MRCIHYANNNNGREGVYFTEDFDMDAQDVVPPNCEIINDFNTDDDFPATFPTETNLEKRL